MNECITAINPDDYDMYGLQLKEGVSIEKCLKMQFDWTKCFIEILEKGKNLHPELSGREVISRMNVEDCQWNWIQKAAALNSEEYIWLSVESEDQIQAVMIIYHPKTSKISKDEIFYVDYLATAPWNRNDEMFSDNYRGLGKKLLKIAGSYICDRFGYRYGFSLHSLPKALGFYHSIGMTDLGQDPDKQNLNYLEMEEEFARGFFYD